MTPAFIVRPARWKVDEAAIARVRQVVFIEEQGVPEALEWEVADADCLWFLATGPGGEAVGIGRLTPRGRIGRMAVLREWRGRGVGGALLAAVIDAARERGQTGIELSAQIHALPFYARHGFSARGPVYLDAGIAHRTMTMNLGVVP